MLAKLASTILMIWKQALNSWWSSGIQRRIIGSLDLDNLRNLGCRDRQELLLWPGNRHLAFCCQFGISWLWILFMQGQEMIWRTFEWKNKPCGKALEWIWYTYLEPFAIFQVQVYSIWIWKTYAIRLEINNRNLVGDLNFCGHASGGVLKTFTLWYSTRHLMQ